MRCWSSAFRFTNLRNARLNFGVKTSSLIPLVPQGGSQKSKELYSKLLRHLKWYVYLRRAVLVSLSDNRNHLPTANTRPSWAIMA